MAENDINANMFSRLDQFDLYNRLLSRQASTELVLEVLVQNVVYFNVVFVCPFEIQAKNTTKYQLLRAC